VTSFDQKWRTGPDEKGALENQWVTCRIGNLKCGSRGRLVTQPSAEAVRPKEKKFCDSGSPASGDWLSGLIPPAVAEQICVSVH
jgi:hypothetical protein